MGVRGAEGKASLWGGDARTEPVCLSPEENAVTAASESPAAKEEKQGGGGGTRAGNALRASSLC